MNARVAEIKIARAVPVESLKLHPRNPRTHAEPGSPIWEILRRSLEHAYFEPLAWHRQWMAQLTPQAHG